MMISDSETNKSYIAIDLKSFYASVECVERGLDPLTTNLVVADPTRTSKTICLALTPALKARGIGGRPRLFELEEKIKAVNSRRRQLAGHPLHGRSTNDAELRANPDLEVDYIVAPPQMGKYLRVSDQVYKIYLQYVAPEDLEVYSVDEVFIDVTNYLRTYKTTPGEMAMQMIHHVLKDTGITATAGIGTNLYLAKIAMDIMAKKMPPDSNGVRIAQLDERRYREQLWNHEPLTDFWHVGQGYADKLNRYGIRTMGDIALCSNGRQDEFFNESLLYNLFGVSAEFLIDHAWGWEPCTMEDVKKYRCEENSLNSGQVLQSPYSFAKARLVVQEMTEELVLDLIRKGLMTNQLTLTAGYDISNLTDNNRKRLYSGPVTEDRYGRKVPKHAHGTFNMDKYNASPKLIGEAMMKLFDRIVNSNLLIRRLNISANHLLYRDQAAKSGNVQLGLFEESEGSDTVLSDKELQREQNRMETILQLQDKYGKNAVLKGRDLLDGATTRQRHQQIGGHKA